MEVSRKTLFMLMITFFVFGNTAVLLLDISLSNYLNNRPTQSEIQNFISKCNKQFGSPQWNNATWVLVPTNDYITYSPDFWKTHNFIPVGPLGLKGQLYYCEGINEYNTLQIYRKTKQAELEYRLNRLNYSSNNSEVN